MTGWEIPDLLSSLRIESKGGSDALKEYRLKYPLCALSRDNRYFVIIRKFNCRVNDGKITLLNSAAENGLSHIGMTIVSANDNGASSWNVFLPSSLQYSKVEIDGTTITIHSSDGSTITNVQEIKKLWTLHKLTEEEICSLYGSFGNKSITNTANKLSKKKIDSDFYGTLSLDTKTDSYCGMVRRNGTDLAVSFSNVDEETFNKNLVSTMEIILKIEILEKHMIKKMLKLKNDSWLEKGQKRITASDFLRQVNPYALNTYADGTVELYYKAGDLFWGHEIVTSIDSEGIFKDATITG
jgi:hypothetical protein